MSSTHSAASHDRNRSRLHFCILSPSTQDSTFSSSSSLSWMETGIFFTGLLSDVHRGNTSEEQHGNAAVVLIKTAARVVSVVTDAVYATAAEVMYPITCGSCDKGSGRGRDALDHGNKSRASDCWFGAGVTCAFKTFSNYLFLEQS